MNTHDPITQASPSAANPSAPLGNLLLVEARSQSGQTRMQDKLLSQGLGISTALQETSSLAETVLKTQPSVLVLAIDFLDAQTLAQLSSVHSQKPMPIVVFADQHSPDVVKTVVSAGVSAYIVDDVQAHRLPVILDLAVERFKQMNLLSNELQQTKEKLSERKIIEKAKGIIMQQKHLSEEEAYSQMRKTAMNQGQSMVVLARRIISVFEMLD